MKLNFYPFRLLCLGCMLAVNPVAPLFSQCGTNPSSGTTTLSGAAVNPNTYYPGTGNPVVGATSITLGTLDARASSTAIAAGNLIMIIQMQGADIDNSNTNLYGDGVASAQASGYKTTNLYAGYYEYATVASVAGSVLTLSYGLAGNYYTQAYNGTLTTRAYQVIRVPRDYDINIAASTNVTAPAWNGATGGVLVMDAVNIVTFSAATSIVTVAGKGFRGGGGRQLVGGTGLTNTDYRYASTGAATNSAGGSKGEGIAGTPIFLVSGTTTVTGSVEGYLGGAMGRGAPGNAGGGGTDGDPTTNSYNTGGGGGGNGGAGGNGGSGWDGTGGSTSGVYPTGGAGGAAFTQSEIQRVVMGGGGGAGDANNSTTANEANSSGAAGGGIIFIRAKSYAGNGSIIADGGAALDITSAGQTDGAGGGGAGGSMIIVTRAAGAPGLTGITASAKGGKGGNMATYYSHGPGGGGGGGVIITNGVFSSTAVTAGANGLTEVKPATSGTPTDPYGAVSGSAGILVSLGYVPTLHNYANSLSPCGVLPIVLKEFRATATGETTVSLSWTVDQQVNFKQFGIEYSADGSHFNIVGTIAFDAGKMNYQFTHQPLGSQVNYYRLKLIDNDGAFSYSNVLSVRLLNISSSVLAVYPNPAVNNITIRVQAAATQNGNIQLTDNSGRLIIRKQASLIKGQNFISFPEMDRLPAGMYHLRMDLDGKTYTEKLMKK